MYADEFLGCTMRFGRRIVVPCATKWARPERCIQQQLRYGCGPLVAAVHSLRFEAGCPRRTCTLRLVSYWLPGQPVSLSYSMVVSEGVVRACKQRIAADRRSIVRWPGLPINAPNTNTSHGWHLLEAVRRAALPRGSGVAVFIAAARENLGLLLVRCLRKELVGSRLESCTRLGRRCA